MFKNHRVEIFIFSELLRNWVNVNIHKKNCLYWDFIYTVLSAEN